MAHSDVSAALIAAYRATEYHCGRGRDAFVLRIGTRSPALMQLCASAVVWVGADAVPELVLLR